MKNVILASLLLILSPLVQAESFQEYCYSKFDDTIGNIAPISMPPADADPNLIAQLQNTENARRANAQRCRENLRTRCNSFASSLGKMSQQKAWASAFPSCAPSLSAVSIQNIDCFCRNSGGTTGGTSNNVAPVSSGATTSAAPSSNNSSNSSGSGGSSGGAR